MTRFVPILIILLAGCATTPPSQKTDNYPTKKPQKKVVATAAPKQPPPPRAKLLPMNARIVGGQKDFRFVIIDFTNGRRPQLDEKLAVYRVGQKVGEVKVSGPFGQDTTVAADLVAGEATYGDEVRPE